MRWLSSVDYRERTLYLTQPCPSPREGSHLARVRRGGVQDLRNAFMTTAWSR